jgi:preflagellin peptidase FlaK
MDPLQLSEYAAILVTLFFYVLSSIFDLRTREVDDKVWLVYGSIGAALTAFHLILDSSALIVTAISIAVATILALAIFYFGLFGGADAKAIICLGLTLPLAPRSFQSLLGYPHPFFPVTVMITGYICSASVAVWFGLRNSLTYARDKRKMFAGLEEESKWRKLTAFFTGYRASLFKLRSTFYLYPMEEIPNGATKRSFKFFFDAEIDRDQLVSKFLESFSKLGFQGDVWVTPGLPMLLFILIGLVITLIFGDVVFSTVLLKAAH